MTKKKVLFISNISFLKTGFGRHNKQVITELYKTDKYDIVEYGTGGIRKTDPLLNRLPWKAIGAWPDNENDIGPIVQGKSEAEKAQLLNMIGHGILYIDEIIATEKPDVVIVLEDIWQIDWLFTKPWWNKIPSALHTPIDSLPILKSFEQNKDKLSNLWVKADFAVDALKELGIKSEFIPMLIDHNDFKPIPENDRIGLKRLYGIEDDFIIGFVARNQLRKLYPSLMEGFKLFKDKHPKAKARLYFHCDWLEPSGWRIVEERERIGLKPEDVLCTYVCSSCRGIRVSPFQGNQLNCNRCRAEKTVNNPNIGLGVTEEELNAVYNMMDAYIHPATSGGFEAPMLEAMLAGVPTATMPYSFGQMFVEGGFCEPIDFTYFREGVSQFYKSNPSIQSIADVIEKMFLNREEYKQKGLAGRQWALEKFNPKKYVEKIEKFIDESVNTYDFEKPASEEKPVSIHDFINKESNKKKLIYIIPEGSEDCFASLGVIEGMMEAYPTSEWDYYISTKPEYFEIFEHLNVANLIPYHPMMEDFRNLEGSGDNKGLFDIAFHPYVSTQRMLSFHRNGIDLDQLQK